MRWVAVASLIVAPVPGLAQEPPAMRSPLWRGVDRIVVACRSGPGVAGDTLCAAALANLRADSPWPVAEVREGAAARRGDALVLLRFDDEGGGVPVLLASVERGVVIDDAEDGLVARPVRLERGRAGMAAGVARALDSILPWRRRSTLVPSLRGRASR